MSEQFGLSSFAVDTFFKRAPIAIKRAPNESDLEEFLKVLTEAGADASIKKHA